MSNIPDKITCDEAKAVLRLISKQYAKSGKLMDCAVISKVIDLIDDQSKHIIEQTHLIGDYKTKIDSLLEMTNAQDGAETIQ